MSASPHDGPYTVGVPAVDQRGPQVRPAIEVRDLRKSYGHTHAVAGLSFTVPYGRVTGFLGPNGACKTTTLRSLLGLVTPDSGTVLIDGVPFIELPDPAHTVGAVIECRFHPGRTGRTHLRTIAAAAGIARSRVDEVLDIVDLSGAGRRRAGGYSLGMRQRLGIAAALLGDPRILILDEPANGLDPQGIAWLRDLLRAFAAQGRAVLVSSHVLAEVSQTVDDVVIVRQGQSVMQASLDAMMADRSDVRIEGPDAVRLGEILSHRGAQVSRGHTGGIVVSGADATQIGSAIAQHGLVITELMPISSSLEEVFLELTANPGGGVS